MSDKNLVKGFEQNEQEEKEEEIRKYGLKQKQKAKNRINLILNIILGFILFIVIIYVLNLNNKISQKDFEIKILKQGNKDLINTLKENKENIDRISQQNDIVQDKSLSLLNQCYNEKSSLNDEINELKEELLYNEKLNKEKLDELIRKNNDLRDKINYMNNYYNIC